MRKIIFALALGIFSTAAIAQKDKTNHVVPEAVQKAFSQSFPSAKAEWEMKNDAYEAEFEQNGAEMSVIYDKAGTRLLLEVEIKITDLPAAAAEYAKKNFTAKIKTVSKIVDNKGVITYGAEIGKMDLIFDANGQYLKTEVEADDKDGEDK